MNDCLVMKFGGASVCHPEDFSRIAQIIIERKKQYKNIVVVISAMLGMTDHLINMAYSIHDHPPKREIDMMISVGERISISLLAIALAKKNISAISLTGSQSGIITSSNHFDAKIIDVIPNRIIAALQEEKIVVVAGFQGVSKQKDVTTLGRGGSDTTAVALGISLEADCIEFYKDVEGIYDQDPKNSSLAKLFSQLSYEQALIIADKGAKVLHARCIKLAQNYQIPLHLYCFKTFFDEKKKNGTIIGKKSFTKQKKFVYGEVKAYEKL